MFDAVKYLQSNITVQFPEQRALLDDQTRLDAILRGAYYSGLPIPESDSGGQGRVLLFSSRHGFSQIVVSSTSIVLNGNYSPDWQVQPGRIEQYLDERVERVYSLLDLSTDPTDILFIGIVHRIQIPCTAPDRDIIDHLARLYLSSRLVDDSLNDLILRTTSVVSGHFYCNYLVQNYRLSNIPSMSTNIVPLSNVHTLERGVESTIDFNSRYSFNEDAGFVNNQEGARRMIQQSFIELNERIATLTSASS